MLFILFLLIDFSTGLFQIYVDRHYATLTITGFFILLGFSTTFHDHYTVYLMQLIVKEIIRFCFTNEKKTLCAAFLFSCPILVFFIHVV